jgi:hypothetical protein
MKLVFLGMLWCLSSGSPEGDAVAETAEAPAAKSFAPHFLATRQVLRQRDSMRL